MKKIKDFFIHVYFALRYGDWYFGYEKDIPPTLFEMSAGYFDGNYWEIRVYKFWVSVSY